MSVDLAPVYANGLKTRTRSYTKLEKLTLSDANNLAVKDEVTHFVEDIRDHHFHKENKRRSGNRSQEVEICHFCKNLGHIKADSYAWKREQAIEENENPRH
ncbi:hypothetical protein F442_14702 [Phytophthora nicotianae P10297]|uniref:Uncharacterized protein n=1 Tax=Phytophthora nicotianae P10297 TaxID=1317064 RepID=W2YRA6_PHYNI|nr:hypothetical protein F442_14702 [Phytophthora nicotianae P10297]